MGGPVGAERDPKRVLSRMREETLQAVIEMVSRANESALSSKVKGFVRDSSWASLRREEAAVPKPP